MDNISSAPKPKIEVEGKIISKTFLTFFIIIFFFLLFRSISTETSVWIAGPPVKQEKSIEEKEEETVERTIKSNPFRFKQLQQVVDTGFTLLANKEKYRLGDECLVLVNPPFYPAEGTFVLGRESR